VPADSASEIVKFTISIPRESCTNAKAKYSSSVVPPDPSVHFYHCVCLEMFGCLQAERTIAIRKRRFLNKFSVIHNALCRVFVAIAETEVASCCTDV